MADGNSAALAQLYDHSSSLLYGLAMRMLRSPEDAEEIVHDAYARAWRTASSYDGERGSVLSWLVLMTRSIAIDRIRSRRRQPEPSRPEVLATLETPESTLVSNERAVRVRKAIRDLPDDQRKLLELAFFRGLSHTEIAETAALPLGTVKTRIRAGLLRLRVALEDVWL